MKRKMRTSSAAQRQSHVCFDYENETHTNWSEPEFVYSSKWLWMLVSDDNGVVSSRGWRAVGDINRMYIFLITMSSTRPMESILTRRQSHRNKINFLCVNSDDMNLIPISTRIYRFRVRHRISIFAYDPTFPSVQRLSVRRKRNRQKSWDKENKKLKSLAAIQSCIKSAVFSFSSQRH